MPQLEKSADLLDQNEAKWEIRLKTQRAKVKLPSLLGCILSPGTLIRNGITPGPEESWDDDPPDGSTRRH